MAIKTIIKGQNEKEIEHNIVKEKYEESEYLKNEEEE
jgi:hypothetical protein